MTDAVLAPTLPANSALAAALERCKGRQGVDGPSALRKPGRPQKKTPEYYRRLLEEHAEAETWFLQAFGQPGRSVEQIYIAWFKHQLSSAGGYRRGVSEERVQGVIKTLRNDLSEARKLAGLSRKPGFIRDRANLKILSTDGQQRGVLDWKGWPNECSA